MKRMKKEDKKANPAPGPIYASAFPAKLKNEIVIKGVYLKSFLIYFTIIAIT